MKYLTRLTIGTALAVPALLPARAADPASRRVAIECEDLTRTQPPSSAPFVSHVVGLHLWEMSKPAGVPIQVLAEDGNPEWILGATVNGTGASKGYGDAAMGLPALPGGKRRIELQVDEGHPMVSGAWMLGKTNDGFAGVDAVDAYHLRAPLTVEVFALDAGTEVNSERKEFTPALGGLLRDPEHGVVALHPGVRGDADLPASVRFDPAKPVGRVTITPMQPAS
ncbi:MAG TPA: spondin domain-containing protein [Acetobacteraceae bacterium]